MPNRTSVTALGKGGVGVNAENLPRSCCEMSSSCWREAKKGSMGGSLVSSSVPCLFLKRENMTEKVFHFLSSNQGKRGNLLCGGRRRRRRRSFFLLIFIDGSLFSLLILRRLLSKEGGREGGRKPPLSHEENGLQWGC